MKLNLMSLGDHITDPITGQRPSAAERHRMLVESAVVAERAGFNGVNMGEHHGLEYIYSAPPVVLAAIGERTSTLRLGTAVTLMANLDPLRAAEDYATLDGLSNGRVDIVAGRGNFFATTYTLFGQDLEESRERFDEGIELLNLLWTSPEGVTWKGEFRPPINGEKLQPPPIQERTPLWIGGGSSPETADLAARLGFRLMLPSAFGNPAVFKAVADTYREAYKAYGHDDEPELGACWHVSVGTTSQAAKDRWEPRYRRYHEWMTELLAEVNPVLPKHMKPFDYEWLLTNGPAIAGSPQEVVERISTLAELLGATTHLLYLDMGGMPHDELLEMVELIGSDVIPQLR